MNTKLDKTSCDIIDKLNRNEDVFLVRKRDKRKFKIIKS